MNIDKLNECIELLKKQMGSSLLATSIVSTSDAQAIADYNSKPGADAIFIEVTNLINDSLKKGYPQLGKYYLLELEEDSMLIVIPLGEYQWIIAVDTTKAKLGLIMNVVLPDAISAFENALSG
ncbi:MAG: hypothetical protein J7J07_04745 [Syntrophobacterales bacterium]|nr:hypothetical protein [Syntrophobacterales bacterium]